jgi:hypothetical protein
VRAQQGAVIDTVLAGIERDGTRCYVSKADAGRIAVGSGLLSVLDWVFDHPQETFRALIVAASLYVVCDAIVN